MGFEHYHSDSGLKQDNARCIRYCETAAKRGNVENKHNLGADEAFIKEGKRRPCSAALHHFSQNGLQTFTDMIKGMFAHGQAAKAQYAEALKGYQDAVEEMKSPERDEAMRL